MRAISWFAVGLAALAAAGDWLAVGWREKRLEYVCKPLVMVFLLALAASFEVDGGEQRWFLAALGLSLLGDVLLMLPRDAFVAGLVAFLLGHLAYVAGLWSGGVSGLGFVIGLAVAAVAVAVVGGRIVTTVRAGEQRALAIPVVGYMTVISVMVASAIGTTEPFAIGGAALFYGSDALIAWQRFVRPRPWQPLAIIVAYHLGQAGLTLSLLT